MSGGGGGCTSGKCHPVARESAETPHQSVSQPGRFRIYSPQSDVYSLLPFLNERLAITPSLTAENYCRLNEELTPAHVRACVSIQRSLRLLLNWAPACDLTCHMASLPNVHFLPSFYSSPRRKVEVEGRRKREGKGWMRHEVKQAWTARWEERDQVKAGGEIKGGAFRKFSVFFCFFTRQHRTSRASTKLLIPG